MSLTSSDYALLKSSLQQFVAQHLPLGRAMGIDVHHYDSSSLALAAPLALNDNDKDTAFGGSLYCVAVMSCWSSVYLRCLEQQLIDPTLPRGTPNIVVSKAAIEYLAPVRSEQIVAHCSSPAAESWDVFFARYASHGSAKISLASTVNTDINGKGKTAVDFSGAYSLIGFY